MSLKSGRLIFLAWDASHAAIFDAISSEYQSLQYFPINQKAAAPLLQAGDALGLPPFWTLYSAADLERIDRSADCFAEQWGGTPEDEINIARAWIWARECAHLNNLLDALEQQIGEKPRYLVPQGINTRSTGWHDGFLVPIAVMRLRAAVGTQVNWVKVQDYTLESDKKDVWQFPEFFGAGTGCLLLSTFGIPDLLYHVSNLLRVCSGDILLLVDPSDPLPLAVLDNALIRLNPRVKIIHMCRDLSNHGYDHLEEEAWSIDRWIIRTGPAYGKLLDQLRLIVGMPNLRACIVSDHHSPQTVVLRHLCAEKAVPMNYFPHSSWPLEGVFSALSKADPGNSRFFASISRGVTHLSNQYGVSVNKKPMPSPRYAPKFSRLWHKGLQWISTQRMSRFNIGIVITSGEELSAPDIPVSELAADLDRLIASIFASTNVANITIRLRENEDRRAVLQFLSESARNNSIVWESTSSRTSLEFLRAMDLVVELGTPGSIMLESFSQLTPFLHFGGCGIRRAGYATSVWASPLFSEGGIDRWLRLCMTSRVFRNFLCVSQFGYLLTQTLPRASVGSEFELMLR